MLQYPRVLLREHLRTQGAECVDTKSSTQEWCNGKYVTTSRTERWLGAGYDLEFSYSSPNPVGPQQNGWRIKRGAACPEWAESARSFRRDVARIKAGEDWETVLGVNDHG